MKKGFALWRETKKAVLDTEASLALGRETATAATVSANAANQQVGISMRSGRPFVFASIPAAPQLDAHSTNSPNMFIFFADVLLSNYGPHPAIIILVSALLQIGETPPELDPTTCGYQGTIDRVITAQGSAELIRCPVREPLLGGADPSLGRLMPRISREQKLFLRIKVDYDGALTKGHCTEACWYWSTPHRCFLVYGGATLNSRL